MIYYGGGGDAFFHYLLPCADVLLASTRLIGLGDRLIDPCTSGTTFIGGERIA